MSDLHPWVPKCFPRGVQPAAPGFTGAATAFCHPLHLRVPPAGGEEGDLGQRNPAGSPQAGVYCFYQGLSRACSTDMRIYKSHMNTMQLSLHAASCRNVPGGVYQHTRPITRAQAGASFVRPQQTAPKHFRRQQEYIPATR